MNSDHKVWLGIIVSFFITILCIYSIDIYKTSLLIKNGYCQKIMYNGTSRPENTWVKCDLLKCN